MASILNVLCAIDKADMDAESLERQALDATPDGDWDLLPQLRHVQLQALADREGAAGPPVPEDFSASTRQLSFPGSREFGIKDPVLVRGQDLRVWATSHPLTEGDDNADQMTSVNAYNGEPVMVPEPGTWYSRGTRITALVGEYAYFDGRASAEQNFEERTGIAKWNGSRYLATAGPASSPFGGGALRYVTAITLPDGQRRLYYESATKYNSHELRTELCPPP